MFGKIRFGGLVASLGTVLLLVGFGGIREVRSFSAGVPPLRSVCSDMLPHHHEYKPQTTPAPYEILTSSDKVVAGSDVIVTLKSTTPGVLFRGFYMQARDENSKPIGTFAINEDAKAHSCNGVRYNSVHHANGKVEKPSVSVTWTAPKGYSGEVIFISTVVKDFVTIWAGIYSEAVTVTPFVKKPLFDDGGTGLISFASALGINIPGITPPQNNNPNNQVTNNARSNQTRS